mmetsp:Transcript_2082/g.2636  ORF Transcript_2082/g.2636 Transcript_2082/m.2636 type:complete len:90 (-) Transcript_2082:154-423(-)
MNQIIGEIRKNSKSFARYQNQPMHISPSLQGYRLLMNKRLLHQFFEQPISQLLKNFGPLPKYLKMNTQSKIQYRAGVNSLNHLWKYTIR